MQMNPFFFILLVFSYTWLDIPCDLNWHKGTQIFGSSIVHQSRQKMTFELKSGSTQLQFDMDLPSDDLRRVKVEPMTTGDGDEDSSQFSMSPRDENDHETDMCLKMFETWTHGRQTEFVEQLIARMSFHQHEHIYSILMPILQRDFITALPSKPA